MKNLGSAVLLLAGLLGCAGPRAMPALDPPPDESSTVVGKSPSPVGAWTSVSIKGPGSAWVRRVDVLFHGDGHYLSIAEGDGTPRLVSGTYVLADGVLTIERPGAAPLRFSCRRDGDDLVLADKEAELRLVPFRE